MVCNIDSSKCMIHRCESCLDTATLKRFLGRELKDHEDDEKFKYCQWDTSHIYNLYSHLRRVQKDFDWCYWWLNKIFLYREVKINSSCYRTKSKAATGVMNTESYIPWLYTTWDQMVVSNMIHCVLVLMTTNITQAFCIKFKHCLFIILKLMAQI